MGPVACPIRVDVVPRRAVRKVGPRPDLTRSTHIGEPCGPARLLGDGSRSRSEEHTSELQSQSNLVCRLLLEKKNKETSLQHAVYSTHQNHGLLVLPALSNSCS